MLHDLTFADGTKISAEAHTVATGEVTIPSGGLTFICSVPGHADAGMRGEVMVAATGEPGASASPAASMTAEQMAAADAARTGEFPAETEGRGNQVLEPTDPGRRDQAVGADRIGHPMGDRAGGHRRGLRLQRHGAGAAAARQGG